MPASVYTSKGFFALEQRRLFPRTWTGVAFDADVPSPGRRGPGVGGGGADRRPSRRGGHGPRVPQRVPAPRHHRAAGALPGPEAASVPLPRLDLRARWRAPRNPLLGRHRQVGEAAGRCCVERARAGSLRGLEPRDLRQPRRERTVARRVRRADGGGVRPPRHGRAPVRLPHELGVQRELEARDGQLGGLPPRLGARRDLRAHVGRGRSRDRRALHRHRRGWKHHDPQGDGATPGTQPRHRGGRPHPAAPAERRWGSRRSTAWPTRFSPTPP